MFNLLLSNCSFCLAHKSASSGHLPPFVLDKWKFFFKVSVNHMGIHFGLRNSPGHHQLVYIQGVPEKMVHSDFFTLRRELESTSISGQSRTFFFGNFVDWAPTRANFLFKKTCFQAFLNIFFPSKQLCNTLRWSTDRSWTWEQGLTNASLLVGEILSKNSWQWANLLWTNSAKATM